MTNLITADIDVDVTLVATAGQTVFTFNFPIFEEADLLVYLNDVEATGYTVLGVGSPAGGSVVFTTGRSSGDKVRLLRDVAIRRSVDLPTVGPYSSDDIDKEFDRGFAILQQLRSMMRRALLAAQGALGFTVPTTSNGQLVATMDGSLVLIDANGLVGPPGGNVQSVALFTVLRMGLVTIPGSATLVRSNGYSEVGVGAAWYVEDAIVTSSYATANPRTSFIDGAGRGFRLAETVRTPYMFGALGIRSGDTDLTMADDYLPLQAFLNDAFPFQNRALVYDFQGDWATSQALYACYPIAQAGSPTHDHPRRRFICGNIRALPLSRQPGGVPMQAVLTVGGHHPSLTGSLYLSGLTDTYSVPSYLSRRAERGLVCFFATFGRIEKVVCEGFKRDGVYLDPSDVARTFQAGTPYEVTYPYSNNIGLRIESCFGRWLGSYGGSGRYSKNWTAMVHGHTPPDTATFDATNPAAWVSSNWQRTKLTFDSTAEFRKWETGCYRHESTAADYGTIAADNAAGTFTWSAGDPVAKGFVVGDRVMPQSGINADDTRYEILGFSGTSNRTIKVWPKPKTEAATALTGFHTRWHPYTIEEVLSPTEILVSPFMETRAGNTGKWTFFHGFAANVIGSNTANVNIGVLCGLVTGGTLNAQCLYGPHIGSLISEYTDLAIVQGYNTNSAQLGTVVDHIHVELCEFSLIQNSFSNAMTLNIKGGSNFHRDRVWGMTPKTSVGSALMPPRVLGFTTIDEGGQPLFNRHGQSYSGNDQNVFTITNRPGERDVVKLFDAITVNIGFDQDTARLASNHHWAQIYWQKNDGSAPAGGATFALDAELTHRGWTVVGGSPIGALTKPCVIRIHYYWEAQRVLITRYDAA